MSLAYFADDLNDRLTALERAIEAHPSGDFRDNCLFALNLVRLSLGLETALTIPTAPAVLPAIRQIDYNQERGKEKC